MTNSLLPNQIPPQTAPFGHQDQNGLLYVDINWYLFLYNLGLQVLTSGGSTPTSQADLIDMADLDAAQSDIQQFPIRDNNVELLQSDEIPGPTIMDLTNAVMMGLDPDNAAQALHAATATSATNADGTGTAAQYISATLTPISSTGYVTLKFNGVTARFLTG